MTQEPEMPDLTQPEEALCSCFGGDWSTSTFAGANGERRCDLCGKPLRQHEGVELPALIAEVERLRARVAELKGENARQRDALEASADRFRDLSKIAQRTPWPGYDNAAGFMNASARRIDAVLNGQEYNAALALGAPDA